VRQAYKFRLYPNRNQERELEITILIGRIFPLLSRMGGVALPLWAVLVLATAGSASARTQTSTRSLDGLWLTDGYREFVEFRGDDMRSYEITALSCIPVVNATRMIEMGAVGEIVFVGEYDTIRISPGPSPETRWLHADGSISNILLRRAVSRPEACGQPVADTPLTNYQVFWETFAENYPFFALRKMDWLAVNESFRPQVTPKTTPAELFQILSHMIEPLYDAHTAIRAYSIRQGFRGYRPAIDPMQRKSAARIAEIIEANYARGGLRSYCNKQLQFGLLTGPTQNSRLPDSIGYLRIHSFSRYSDDREFAKQLDALETSLDDIFKDSAKFAGLVIDVRINGGGSDVFGVSIASRLAAHDYFAYSKVARNDVRDPKHRTPPQPIIVHASSRPGFHGPVVLLTSSDTVSAAETFTMAVLGRQPHVIRVGANTQGVFSDVLNRTLPNGWSFGLPVEIYLTKDGKAFDGLGVPPDIAVPIFTAEDIANGRDSAIDKALELLAPKVK
jgi:Peptidase family S41/Tricorn protease C1 domain/Helix-turn-helix domain